MTGSSRQGATEEGGMPRGERLGANDPIVRP